MVPEQPKEFLSDEDKKFIVDNYNKMSPFQIAVRLNIKTEKTKCQLISDFIKNSGLQPKSAEVVSEVIVKAEEKNIEEKIKEIVEEQVAVESENMVSENPYKDLSIEEFATILRELNIHVRSPLNEKEKRDIVFLMKQTESTRYILTYRSYRKKDYKKLFREEFIRSMYGKSEMPQEEVNDFIDVCAQIVLLYDIKCKMGEIEKIKEDPKIEPRYKMAADQTFISLTEKYDDCLNRIAGIKKQLGATREQRLKESRPSGLTVNALIEAFQNTEKRESFAKLQDSKDEKLKETLKKFSEMEASKALIMGISEDELLQGGL
jgi:hypothetical protein